MTLIDSILNLACLLLWLNWRAFKTESLQHARALTLAGNLKRVGAPGKRGKLLLILAGILFGRALIYWQVGSGMDWTPHLQLGATSPAFDNTKFTRMLLYSLLSFGETLGFFFLCLLFLSLLPANPTETNPVQRWARLQLGRVDRWPWLTRALLPMVVCVLLWLMLSPLFAWLGVIPKSESFAHNIEQGLLIGIAAYLVWKYLIAGLLLLHLINSYIYLGNHPTWNFVNVTARKLLRPLQWLPLRFAKVDFAPVAGIAIVFAIAEGISRLISKWFQF